ncbi:MAG: FAD-dependent oxidoreductase [Pseudomonadota bacterium]
MSFDLAIVGAGIAGLWTARLAAAAGLRAVVLEAETLGAGASGTPLGALLPHLPRSMSDKKRFQFVALAELEGLITQLEEETGRTTGYVRAGRIMPIRTERFRASVSQAIDEAVQSWRSSHGPFELTLDDTSSVGGWLSAQEAPLGIVRDTLSARVRADDYLATLATSLDHRTELRQGVRVTGFDAAAGRVQTSLGTLPETVGALVVTAGVGSFPLFERLLARPFGAGVKGQAAVFELTEENQVDAINTPVIYDNGVYLVPRDTRHIAAGATSERAYAEPVTAKPEDADAFISRATSLCPALAGARLVKHWAGVRPRAEAKDPLVGCLDPTQRVWALTGGYKITFGIAHRLARRLIEEITGAPELTPIPDTYEASFHLAQSSL